MDPFIDIHEYTYDLPPERIALYPLPQRDQSKLLVYRHGSMTHSRFDALDEFIPPNAILIFNDTKVIPARLIFQKETGAEIEIFLLNPLPPTLLAEAMQATGSIQWQCSIGNLKRWNDGKILVKQNETGTLQARLVNRDEPIVIVEFAWSSLLSFAEVIRSFGDTPLPPYIKRKAEPSDLDRYQTIYSQASGAVAAPTAGLHFTKRVLDNLQRHGILTDFLTLHVSAGTFLPVKVQNAVTHDMHAEQVIISERTLHHLLLPDRPVLAVGTTSLRTLESLYWYGVKLLGDPDAEFTIQKFDPYAARQGTPTKEESFRAIAGRMSRKNMKFLTGETSIYILPGYPFRVVDGLITNFHQPQSTLLLLIAAFIGKDWKKIYREVLEKDYRFLSYGDSSLLFRNKTSRTNDSSPPPLRFN
jgi:S-adenosylmethionine:tRNA ribosyltransferase-isomerase